MSSPRSRQPPAYPLFRLATILTAVFRLWPPAQDVHSRLEFQPRLVFGPSRLPVRIGRLQFLHAAKHHLRPFDTNYRETEGIRQNLVFGHARIILEMLHALDCQSYRLSTDLLSVSQVLGNDSSLNSERAAISTRNNSPLLDPLGMVYRYNRSQVSISHSMENEVLMLVSVGRSLGEGIVRWEATRDTSTYPCCTCPGIALRDSNRPLASSKYIPESALFDWEKIPSITNQQSCSQ